MRETRPIEPIPTLSLARAANAGCQRCMWHWAHPSENRLLQLAVPLMLCVTLGFFYASDVKMLVTNLDFVQVEKRLGFQISEMPGARFQTP